MPPRADRFHDQLRAALVNAVPGQVARARRRAQRRRAASAALVLLALVGAIVTFALPDRRADAQIDVEQRDGRVHVRLLELESRPDEIVRALANAGINATVELVPASPSNVGKFVSASLSETGQFAVNDGTKDSFRSFSLNADYAGELSLGLGRESKGDEPWRGAGNALAPGEPLACRQIVGLPAAQAAAALAGDTTIAIRWFAVANGETLAGVDPHGAHASWLVIDALSISRDAVVVRLTQDGSWPFLIERPPAIDPRCKGR